MTCSQRETPNQTQSATLGLDACEKLGLIQIDDAVDSTVTSTLIDEYADVFSGFGAMPVELINWCRPVIAFRGPATTKSSSQGEVNVMNCTAWTMEHQQMICKRQEPTDG